MTVHSRLLLKGTALGTIGACYESEKDASAVLHNAFFNLKGCTDDSTIIPCDGLLCNNQYQRTEVTNNTALSVE